MRWRRRDDADAPVDDGNAPPTSRDEGDFLAMPHVPVDLGVVDAHELARAGRRVVARALTEDLAGEQDLTSALTVPLGTTGRALLVAREDGVVAGLDLVREVCSQVDHRLVVTLKSFDGDEVQRGNVVAELSGPLRTLLTAERTLLNLVCHLSGVATRTRAFATELEGTGCVVRDTRKTTPGLRLLEKHAVACGGGANHRIGLYDAVLVKDNHVAAAGSVTAAAEAALAGAPDDVHVQVEVTSLAEAEEAMAAGVVDLLLDNFTPDELRAAVAAIDGRAAVEASGGITLETARAFGEAGADRLAVGALTHSAPSLDLALDVIDVRTPERGTPMTLAAAKVAATPEPPPDDELSAPSSDDLPAPSSDGPPAPPGGETPPPSDGGMPPPSDGGMPPPPGGGMPPPPGGGMPPPPGRDDALPRPGGDVPPSPPGSGDDADS